MNPIEPKPANHYAKWYLTTIILFSLSVLGEFLLFRAYPNPGGLPDDIYLWLHALLWITFAASIVRVRLKDLHHRGKSRGMLSEIAGLGVVRAIATRLIGRERRAGSPAFSLAALAALTLLMVIVLDSNDMLFEKNMELLGAFDRYRNLHPPSDSSASLLTCYTIGRGTEGRLRWILKATEDLKRAGARVVLVKLPKAVSRPYYMDLVEKIRQTGVAVLSVEADPPKAAWKIPRYRTWGTLRDTLNRPIGILSAARLASGEDPAMLSSFGCFVPFGYYEDSFDQRTVNTVRDTIPDATLEVLRKWNDYPETVRPRREGRDVLFGSYRIPVSTAGLAINRAAVMHMIPVFAGDHWEGDSSGYWTTSRYWGVPAEDLSQAASEIMGRIVVLSSHDAGDEYSMERWGQMMTAASIITTTLRNENLRVRDDLDLWLTLFVTVISCYIVLRLRPVLSFLALFCIALVLVSGSVWLSLHSVTVIKVVYPLLALALNMVILPIAKISSEVARDAGTGPREGESFS